MQFVMPDGFKVEWDGLEECVEAAIEIGVFITIFDNAFIVSADIVKIGGTREPYATKRVGKGVVGCVGGVILALWGKRVVGEKGWFEMGVAIDLENIVPCDEFGCEIVRTG